MFKRITTIITVIMITTVLTMTGCSHKDENYGWAGKFDGKTAIAAVFANDRNCKWESGDEELKGRMLDELKIACDFLEENSKVYGGRTQLIHPLSKEALKDERLTPTADIDGTLCNDTPDVDRVDEYLLSAQVARQRADILKNYDCDGIVYLFFLNTDEDNPYPSRSYMWMAPGDPEDEFSLIYAHLDGLESSPAVMAHEILHAFGAPDLYSGEQEGYDITITDEFVNHLKETGSRDIMYSVYDVSDDGKKEMIYGRVGRDFTMLDAYYVGLVDRCSTVDEYGLGKSIYK